MPDQAELRRDAGFVEADGAHARIVLGEDVVHLRLEPVVIHAQPGHQAKPAIGQRDLVLHVQGADGGLAVGEIAHRERVGRHHRRAGAGERKGPHAVALLPGPCRGQIHAIAQIVLRRAGFEVLAEVRLHAVRALIEIEHAVADVAQRRRCQRALLMRVLGGLAVLPVDLPVQAVGETGTQPVPFVRQRQARAGLAIARGHRRVGGAGRGLETKRIEQIGVGVVLGAFHRQAEPLLPIRREHEARQQAAAIALLRIGLGTRGAFPAHASHVPGLLALAMADHCQAAPAFTTERGGGAAEQALPVAFVTQLEAEVGVLAVPQIVGGILGDERHHATERIGTVKGTGGPAHDFHLLDRVQIDQVATGVGEAADRECIGDGNAVGLDPYAIAIQPADAETAHAEAAEAGSDADARLVAH